MKKQPERVPIGEVDPSIGAVHFTDEEEKTMREAGGMTDEQIQRKEDQTNQAIARATVGEELKDSGIEIE